MIQMREAIVVKNAGSHFELSELPEWKPFPALLRGKTRLSEGKSTNPVAVGDRVSYTLPDGMDSPEMVNELRPAIINDILPRRNHVIRRSTNLSRQSHVIAANIDQAILAVSLYFPEIKLAFLDRILVTCGVYHVPVIIALNKVDMYREHDLEGVENFKRIYSGAGYQVIETSTLTGEGIDELREACKGKVSLISGESGVGKSSLIKCLDPNLRPKTGRISEAHLQGKHTTSLYEMYPICGGEGGFIIDTPGLRGFGLVNLEKEEIGKYFPEMLLRADNCRFMPCTHTHEPGCAIKDALEAGEISPERYNSYLGMLEEDKKFR